MRLVCFCSPFSHTLEALVETVIHTQFEGRAIAAAYVDDLIQAAHKSIGAFEVQRSAQQCAVALFALSAIAVHKSVTPCVACPILGWRVDLQSATIRPDDKATAAKVAVRFHVVASRLLCLGVQPRSSLSSPQSHCAQSSRDTGGPPGR